MYCSSAAAGRGRRAGRPQGRLDGAGPAGVRAGGAPVLAGSRKSCTSTASARVGGGVRGGRAPGVSRTLGGSGGAGTAPVPGVADPASVGAGHGDDEGGTGRHAAAHPVWATERPRSEAGAR